MAGDVPGDEGAIASMKAPPKRKGNSFRQPQNHTFCRLNESPSEKEGKYVKRGGLIHLV